MVPVGKAEGTKPEGTHVSKISTYHLGLGSLHHDLQRHLIQPTSGHHQIIHISLSFLIPIKQHFVGVIPLAWLVSKSARSIVPCPDPMADLMIDSHGWKGTIDLTPTWMPIKQVASPKDLSLDYGKTVRKNTCERIDMFMVSGFDFALSQSHE